MEPTVEPLGCLPLPLSERSVEPPPSLCVVLPAFNEAALIPRVCEELARILDALPVTWTVLVVNDGSVDQSLTVLEAAHQRDARVGYVSLSRNFGHQAALAAGLDHDDPDVVITMDADLQHPPTLVPALFAAWRAGYDVVHTRKLDTVGLRPWRRWTTRIAYRFISWIAATPIIPGASDFRLLDRAVVVPLRTLHETARLYRGLTPWIGFRQCVIPYVAQERATGASRYGLRQFFALFTRALFDFSDASLHIGIVLGGTALVFSFGYLLFILGWLLFGRSVPPGWASSILTTLVLNSITLTFLGVIGIYVARIYREVRQRPPYVVSRRVPPVAARR